MGDKEGNMSKHTGFSVTLEAQHDLRCTVPPGSNVLGHVPRVLLRIHGETSCQTKVANLELAVCVYQQISRLQISMEHVCRMDVLESAENLIDEGLKVSVCERLARADDGSQVT